MTAELTEAASEVDPGAGRSARRRAARAERPGRAPASLPLPEGPEPLPERLAGREGVRLIRRLRWRLFGALLVANLLGAAIVVVCVSWVLPGSPEAELTVRLVVTNALLGGVLLFVVVPLGVAWGEAWLRSGHRWLREGRPPTEREVVAVLRSPGRLFLVHLTIWLVAAALFSVANAMISFDLLARVAFTTTLAGITVSAFAYLLAERITRPLAVAALSLHGVSRPRLPGIVTRSLLTWLLGTGVPVAGLVITSIFALAERDATATELAMTMLVLGGGSLLLGWWMTVLGARAVAYPVSQLRRAIDRVADGDLAARVDVSDGSVLGLLERGFNDMAAGLEERERLRDLYGRQVGEEVAAGTLDRGVELGGERTEVAVLFVDVVGSTALAASRPPEEVVGLLNRFFGVVVDEVHRRGGWINKFQGDATLAVFGAPALVDDVAGRALATARAVARRLPREVPELGAGVGVAFGPAVAGHVGDERRFEFTVIGDPVNEAARLTELSKQHRPMVLASADAVAAADRGEAARWESAGTAELRGRARPTVIARPRPGAPPPHA